MAAGPPSEVANPSSSSHTYSMAFCALPGIIARPRAIRTRVTIVMIVTPHMVTIVEVMLGSKTIRPALL